MCLLFLITFTSTIYKVFFILFSYKQYYEYIKYLH